MRAIAVWFKDTPVGSPRQCTDFTGQRREERLASIWTSGLTECHLWGSETEVKCARLHVGFIPMNRHRQLPPPRQQVKCFSSQDWTAQIRLNRYKKFVSASKPDNGPGREPPNAPALTNVRFRAHSGLKSDIAPCPKSARTGPSAIGTFDPSWSSAQFAFENAILPWTSMACRSISPSRHVRSANWPEI
jgi:hypothetical protein